MDAYLSAFREFTQVPALAYRILTSDTTGLKGKYHPFGPHKRQYLFAYEPQKGSAEKDLLIYFIHGGGWRVGNPMWRRPLVNYFTQLGYPVITPTYRLTPTHQFEHIREDVSLAFQKALSLPISQHRKILLIGESAGGNLAGLLMYDREELWRLGVEQDRFAGFLSVVGALDMDEMPHTFVLESYCGKKGSEIYTQANPVTYLRKDEETPVFILHGTNDGLVPLDVALSFGDHLNGIQKGLAQTEIIQGGTHFGLAADWYHGLDTATNRIFEWISMIE